MLLENDAFWKRRHTEICVYFWRCYAWDLMGFKIWETSKNYKEINIQNV